MLVPLTSFAPRQFAEFSLIIDYPETVKRCYALALKCKNPPAALEAEDLVQEALLKIREANSSIDSTKSPWPFVTVIAKNAFKDACKRYGKYQSVPVDSKQFDALSFSLEEHKAPTNVNLFSDFLTDRQKEILKMAFGIEQPYAFSINDIAEELGITRQTVSSDKKKGLKALEEHYRQRKGVRKMTL